MFPREGGSPERAGAGLLWTPAFAGEHDNILISVHTWLNPGNP
jgi:hypothetical protein